MLPVFFSAFKVNKVKEWLREIVHTVLISRRRPTFDRAKD